jgi:hypothetical protein
MLLKVRNWLQAFNKFIGLLLLLLTTVGYGDISPITPLGQLCFFVMILGYGLLLYNWNCISLEYTMTNKINNGAIIPNKTDKSCSEC